MSFHQTIIEGHLGKDVEQRYLPSGDAVSNFSVAVTESWKDKTSGEKKEQTTWYRVNTFGKLAEICGKYLKKGSHVLIIGKMQEREWEKDGVKRTSWELRADSMQMLGSRQSGDESTPKPQRKPVPQTPSGAFNDFEDDIPFN